MNRKVYSIIAAVALITTFCLVPGCLGDKIIGTWEMDSGLVGHVTATFNKDNTAKITVNGIIEIKFENLTWEKSNNEYILKDKEGNIFGTAQFSGENLKITYETGIGGVNITGVYKKAEKES